jgi:hypothetical protein
VEVAKSRYGDLTLTKPRPSFKPSDGLEPSTPSLPWRGHPPPRGERSLTMVASRVLRAMDLHHDAPSLSITGKPGHGWSGHATMRVCALHHSHIGHRGSGKSDPDLIGSRRHRIVSGDKGHGSGSACGLRDKVASLLHAQCVRIHDEVVVRRQLGLDAVETAEVIRPCRVGVLDRLPSFLEIDRARF